MLKKFHKAFVIIPCLLVFIASFAGAQPVPEQGVLQQNNLKITSVNETYFLGTNIRVKGTSSPGDAILLSIKDLKDTFAYSVKTNADANGNWSAGMSQSLKSGEYYIDASEASGNVFQAGQVRYGPVKIKGSFVFIVGVFSILVIILLVAFVGGWYISKLEENKRYGRVLISQRDVVSSYNVLKNDTDRALKNLSVENIEPAKISETKFLLGRISENLEKMNKYVVGGIKVISKYDIINKLENKRKS